MPVLEIEPDVDERTWAERAAEDASLRVFVEAEVARAGVAFAARQTEAARWRETAEGLNQRLQALREQIRGASDDELRALREQMIHARNEKGAKETRKSGASGRLLIRELS